MYKTLTNNITSGW